MTDFLFSQYDTYSSTHIVLEIIAVLFGLASVWFAKNDSIWVFPSGIVSTTIYIYLLWQWGLVGDMSINFYYSIMSIYGWYYWTRKKDNQTEFPIANITVVEKKWAVIIFILTSIGVVLLYRFFDKFGHWTAYVDTFTTGLFFVGMWLMAKRKIEHWLFWIVGDIISVPLYFSKGYTFTSVQYLIFTIIAFYGYIEWKKILNNNPQVS